VLRHDVRKADRETAALIGQGELDTVTLSTLRAYVRALGGKLRAVADFGDQEYRLT
jgi:hypothetical protein